MCVFVYCRFLCFSKCFSRSEVMCIVFFILGCIYVEEIYNIFYKIDSLLIVIIIDYGKGFVFWDKLG